MCTPSHNLHRPRLRHCHSSPQGAPPRKIAVFFGSSGRQSVNLPCFLPKKVSRIGNRLQEDCHFDPFWGSPPTLPRRARAPASWDPVIDLKSLWRSLRSVPHRRWGPPEHKPRDLARAAAPRSRSSQRFPQSWGRIVRPEPKGFVAPRHLQPPVKASANPRNPRISDPNLENPLSLGTPRF